MKTTTTTLLGLAGVLLGPATFVGAGAGDDPLLFDLIEVNDSPGPQNPGIDFQRHPVSTFNAEAGGMAAVDFDDDGNVDLLLTDTEGWPNHLYRNLGDGTFEEIAAARGVDEPSKRRGSALFLDMENDGDFDLLTCGYVSSSVPNFDLYTLFRNNGKPAYDFTDVTQSAGGFLFAPTQEATILGEPGGVTTGDINGNGYLDVFVAYWNRSFNFLHDQPRLWKNLQNPSAPGPGQSDYSERIFLDSTIEAGLDASIIGWIWTPSFVDYDRDGDLDLHINVDFGMDVLRLNNGDGTFAPDIATTVGYNGSPAETRNEMGIAFGDVDFDGDLDTYHTNANFNDRFYRNDSTFGVMGTGLLFEDMSATTDTAKSNYGWGTVFADIDHDQDLDLFSVAGMGVPYINHFYENQWPQLLPGTSSPEFVDRSSDLPDWTKDNEEIDIARSLIFLDHDKDGDLDALVGRYGESAFASPGPKTKAAFYENTMTGGGDWIQIDLVETDGSRNTIGARVHVQTGDVIQSRTQIVGSSFLAQEPYRMHFGLGTDAADWAVVRWFDGSHTVFLNPPSNKVHRYRHLPGDSTGDMDGDGNVDTADVNLWIQSFRRPKAFDNVYGAWPWEIVGDINGDNALDGNDLSLLQQLAQ